MWLNKSVACLATKWLPNNRAPAITAHEMSSALQSTSARPLAIGPVTLANSVALAPMSGVSDLPFRDLAHRFGAGLVVSEMVASEPLVQERGDMLLKARRPEHRPFVIQLAGREARWMAAGARIAADLGADIVDINMGCPSRVVTNGLAGSALMRDLDHALTLIDAVVSAVDRPVTLKMRLGWDDKSLNAPELARRAEDAGIRMLTVHGRTRCQFFKGKADWSLVRRVREAVKVPVVVNGDITSVAEAREALTLSGADGVMVGRGAYGAPWMPGRIAEALATGTDPGDPSSAAACDILLEHYEAMLAHYGIGLGIRNARKHLVWALERCIGGEVARKAWRRRLCGTEEPREVVAAIRSLYAGEAVAA